MRTVMGCGCSDHNNEHEKTVGELFGSVGLKEVVEQGREAIAEAGRALVHLNRSERANSLEFGPEIANVHHDAAKRSNWRAREQLQTILARIDHQVKARDWNGNVKRVRAAFKERGGAKKLQDLRADIRLRLLNEDPGLSATVAELSLAALDSAISAASKGDLNQLMGHVRGILESALRGFESKEMGRQPVGLGAVGGTRRKSDPRPITGGTDVGWCIALAACIAFAWASLIVGHLLCLGVPYCWCCFSLALLVTWGVHQAGCTALLAPLCSR